MSVLSCGYLYITVRPSCEYGFTSARTPDTPQSTPRYESARVGEVSLRTTHAAGIHTADTYFRPGRAGGQHGGAHNGRPTRVFFRSPTPSTAPTAMRGVHVVEQPAEPDCNKAEPAPVGRRFSRYSACAPTVLLSKQGGPGTQQQPPLPPVARCGVMGTVPTILGAGRSGSYLPASRFLRTIR